MGNADIQLGRWAAQELLKRRRARDSFLEYNRYIAEAEAGDAEDEVEPEYPEAHHVLLCEALQALADDGELWGYPVNNLAIMMPPGSAKSTYATVRFPAWYLGRFKRRGVITASYNQTLADHFGGKVRNLVKSAPHRALFPACTLAEDTRAKGEWNTQTGGFYFAVGVGAGVTGRRGDILIGDDLIKGAEEADSETTPGKVWTWWKTDMRTRLRPKHAKRVLIGTRWILDDPIGRILPEEWKGQSCVVRGRDGGIWHVICLPAQARAGDVLGRQVGEWLWPQWFTPEYWEAEKRAQDARTWSALYQQVPVPEEGALFKREWFQWFDLGEEPKHLNRYGASDFAVTEDRKADYTEHGVWGEDDQAHLWALAWWHGQEETDDTIAAQIALMDQFKMKTWFGEGGVIEKAIGPARKKLLRDRIRQGKPIDCAYELLPSFQDKPAKLASFRNRARLGMVHLPRTPWAERLVDQLCSFPYGAHDDAADVCGMIGRGLDQMHAARVPKGDKKKGVTPFSVEWLMSKGEQERTTPSRDYYE